MKKLFLDYKKPILYVIIFLVIACIFAGLYFFVSSQKNKTNSGETTADNIEAQTTEAEISEDETPDKNTIEAVTDEYGKRIGTSLISDPQTDWDNVSEIKIHSYGYRRRMEDPLIVTDPDIVSELVKHAQSLAYYRLIKPEELFVDFVGDVYIDYGNGVVISFNTDFKNCVVLDSLEADSDLYYYMPLGLFFTVTDLLFEDMHTPPEDSAYYGQYRDYSQYCFREKHDGVDFIEKYYTLEDSIVTNILGSDTSEAAANLSPATIEVYTGNPGDGESGFVLVKDAEGKLIYDEWAHPCNAGQNIVYLCENNFLMTLYLEDRYDFGGYSYNVFRLDTDGSVIDIASDSFDWDRSSYDDDEFKEWADGLSKYLSQSYLLLSTEDNYVRTEQVCDKDLYCYETLKPVGTYDWDN